MQQDDPCALAVVEDCQPDLRLLSFFWAAAHGSCDYLSVGVFPAARSRDAAGAQKKKRAQSHPTRSSRHSTLKSRSSALSVSILLSLIRAEIWEP